VGNWDDPTLRQRESSVGNFNFEQESPDIIQMNANYLRNKLSQIDTLPRKWMTQDELYYMAKAPDLWPWQRTNALTPTPPGTPSSMREASSPDNFAGARSWILNCKERQNFLLQQKAPSSKPVTSKRDLRCRPSSKKREKGRIQKKQIGERKHTMVTRSRCQGRCCRGRAAG
jgi:hypothetical protein